MSNDVAQKLTAELNGIIAILRPTLDDCRSRREWLDDFEFRAGGVIRQCETLLASVKERIDPADDWKTSEGGNSDA